MALLGVPAENTAWRGFNQPSASVTSASASFGTLNGAGSGAVKPPAGTLAFMYVYSTVGATATNPSGWNTLYNVQGASSTIACFYIILDGTVGQYTYTQTLGVSGTLGIWLNAYSGVISPGMVGRSQFSFNSGITALDLGAITLGQNPRSRIIAVCWTNATLPTFTANGVTGYDNNSVAATPDWQADRVTTSATLSLLDVTSHCTTPNPLSGATASMWKFTTGTSRQIGVGMIEIRGQSSSLSLTGIGQ